MIAKICTVKARDFNFIKVWNHQGISPVTIEAIEITAKFVHDDIMTPMAGISNISEWCKKEACWDRLQIKVNDLIPMLPKQFFEDLLDKEDVREEIKAAVKTQKIDSGIKIQKAVMEVSAQKWADILNQGQRKRLYSPKEIGILQIATQMPLRIPTEKQCTVLIEILQKAKQEGIL